MNNQTFPGLHDGAINIQPPKTTAAAPASFHALGDSTRKESRERKKKKITNQPHAVGGSI